MNKKVNWLNPYEKKEKYWLKGNLHAHAEFMTTQEVVDEFRKRKFDFLAITDHDEINKLDVNADGIILIPGIEVGVAGKHICLTNPSSEAIVCNSDLKQQELIDKNIENNGLVVLNHPDWQLVEHYTLDELCSFNNYQGIEIFNSVIEELAGTPLSTPKWDRMLAMGRRVLGFANQDNHIQVNYKDCGNVVNVANKNIEDIFNALLSGKFYCYFGVVFEDIGRDGDRIYIKTQGADLIRFVGKCGTKLKEVEGNEADILFTDEPKYEYIRIECFGRGKKMSWSQPFFRE